MKMYDQLASWWPLVSAPEDYAEEAGMYASAIVAASDGTCRTVLELGSGGGNNASHMTQRFDLTLVEPSDGMLAVSRALNPELPHHRGDMRTVRLGRQFDAVFVHDAVCYMTSEADLRAAMATAFAHLRPGGVVLFAPDYVRETFRPGTECGGHDGPSRSARYLEWTWDPDPSDTTYIADYTFTLREADGSVHVEHDRHLEGLFFRGDWLRWLEQEGFLASPRMVDHSEAGGLELFVGRKA
jgi:SAM-dependent methyltransferase